MTSTPQEMLAAALRNECPLCGSHEITGGHVEVETGQAWQQVTCDRCGARWNEIYNIAGVELLDD